MATRLFDCSNSSTNNLNYFETRQFLGNISTLPNFRSKPLKCIEFFDFKQAIKSTWYKLKNEFNETSSCQKYGTKHVMFADKLGLDLEMVHTKSAKISNYQLIDQMDSSITSKNENFKQDAKIIVPKFYLCPDVNYKKLIKNGICLNSIEIYNQSSIRGIVLTLTKSSISMNLNENDAKSKLNLNLDLVYVIWSIDDWKSWKYQAAIQNNCKTNPNSEIIKTHEFFIQNLDGLLHITQRLKLIVCHQIGLVVFKDTNNDKCFEFDCAIKV